MKKNFTLAVVAAAVTFAGAAHAAEDGDFNDANAGTVGSTGSSIISLVKNNAIQISNVDDIDLGTQGSFPLGGLSGNDDVCVHSTTGLYDVTLTSSNGSGDFSLNNGAGIDATDSMAYTVQWTGTANAVGGLGAATPFPVTEGVAINGIGGLGLVGDTENPTCSGGTNANFSVTIDQAAFDGAVSGTYLDTLTILVRSI